MKLREFLLARIAEDEAAASTWYEDWGGNMESLTERGSCTQIAYLCWRHKW